MRSPPGLPPASHLRNVGYWCISPGSENAIANYLQMRWFVLKLPICEKVGAKFVSPLPTQRKERY
ncbi:MAG: hypothetical protein KME32_11740 [Mojavia pulchra JT2-VF2]|uniref:Uncharacterized protein n=1 Tax=Mojavia pulchra JT2-VF2 TaxID=287848 RepID=A0A951PWV6_9NOST|nr:hypothetical protein [Mojavia pulchra JT2-VF2]